jgi:multiple sugar transport system ATP-binding protein
MAEVRYDKATRMYPGTDAPAVNALDLEINEGEFVVLVGPSGSGKTTALRMLAGLEEVDAGTITIGERDVTDLPPKQRDIAMVFQNYALYPYLTVEANIAFPLKIAKVPKEERLKRVRDVAEMLGLTEYLHRKPGQLSGGQRQRVAMGRAMVRRPSVYLMDEPLSNLDAKLRVQMRSDIASLQQQLGVTTVYVTHDQSEAMTLGHRVAALKDGFLQQFDTPDVLYRKPANLFVAGFIGSPAMNLVTLPVQNGSVAFGGVDIPLPPAVAQARSERKLTELVVGFRPEAMELDTAGVPASVAVVETFGYDAHVFCVAELDGQETKLVARAEAKHAPERGANVTIRPSTEDAHFFDPATGERLAD